MTKVSLSFIALFWGAASTAAPLPAPASASCQDVVQFAASTLDRSGMRDLRLRLESHHTTTLILNKDPVPGPAWRDGNDYWQEAYALLQPEIYKHMQTTDARDASHVRTALPAQLSPEFCRKYNELLQSRFGKSAQRLRESHQAKTALEDYERKAMVTPRFEALTQRVRRFIEEGLRIARDPDFSKYQKEYQDAYQSLAYYDSALATEIKRLGPAPGSDPESEREYLVRILRRNQDQLVDIVRRFLLSTRP